MKVAFNFICPLKGWYLFPDLRNILTFICESDLNIQSKISIGDVPIATHDRKLWIEKAQKVFDAAKDGWHTDINMFNDIAARNMIFAIVFHTIDKESASKIDNHINKLDHYIGAFQVDDTVGIHWACYTPSLSENYKLNGKKFYFLWSGIDEEEKENIDVETFQDIPFDNMDFESREMKGTLFDGDDDYEKQVKMAQCRKYLPRIFAPEINDSVIDNILFKVGDSCPALGDKLYAAVKSFLSSENSEDYAHIALSCRRTIEYLADTLFPPIETNENDELKLGKQQSKNRLLAFAHKETENSEPLISFIKKSTELKKKLNKTTELQNKGLHSEIDSELAKKCIKDTLLLINDFVSLPLHSLPPKVRLDKDFLAGLLGRSQDILDK